MNPELTYAAVKTIEKEPKGDVIIVSYDRLEHLTPVIGQTDLLITFQGQIPFYNVGKCSIVG